MWMFKNIHTVLIIKVHMYLLLKYNMGIIFLKKGWSDHVNKAQCDLKEISYLF